jgi:hypothetical protein
MTWDAINQAGQQYGAPDIDYDRFAARWDADPILKQLVTRFDGHGLVVKTKNKEDMTEFRENWVLVARCLLFFASWCVFRTNHIVLYVQGQGGHCFH